MNGKERTAEAYEADVREAYSSEHVFTVPYLP